MNSKYNNSHGKNHPIQPLPTKSTCTSPSYELFSPCSYMANKTGGYTIIKITIIPNTDRTYSLFISYIVPMKGHQALQISSSTCLYQTDLKSLVMSLSSHVEVIAVILSQTSLSFYGAFVLVAHGHKLSLLCLINSNSEQIHSQTILPVCLLQITSFNSNVMI